MKVFNRLPFSIQNFLMTRNNLDLLQKRFLLTNSFYTLDGYFNWKFSKDFGSV